MIARSAHAEQDSQDLVIAAALAGAALALPASPAAARSTTTGAILGRVVDADTGENLAGVTVVGSAGSGPG